jgi:hypothetical protein
MDEEVAPAMNGFVGCMDVEHGLNLAFARLAASVANPA